MLAIVLIIILGGLLGFLAVRPLEAGARGIALMTLAAHIAAAFAQAWIIDALYGGISDAAMYTEYGSMIARLLELNFWQWFPEVIRLGLHIDSAFSYDVFGAGFSTGTMSAITGMLFFIVGDSLVAVALVIAIAAWFGKLMMYKTAVRFVSEDERRVVLWGVMCVPSVIFWSSALAKEAVVMACFGPLVAGLRGLLVERRWRSSLLVAFGSLGVGLLKPYVLFPVMIAVGSSFVSTRGNLKPAYVLLGLLVGLGGIVLLSQLFPEYGVSKIAETTADLQTQGAVAAGGSFVEVGGPQSSSYSAQLQHVPLALLNTFFRPTLVEIRNATSAAAAIEMTFLSLLVVSTLLRLRFASLFRLLLTDRLLSFCTTFVLAFAVAVGLATTNLGTLSRYRVPMMPFYAILVLLIRSRMAPMVRSLPVRRALV